MQSDRRESPRNACASLIAGIMSQIKDRRPGSPRWPTLALTLCTSLFVALGVSDAARELHGRTVLPDAFILASAGLIYSVSLARDINRLECLVRDSGSTETGRWPILIWLELVVPLLNLVAPFLRIIKLSRSAARDHGTIGSRSSVFAQIVIWWLMWLASWFALFSGSGYVADALLNLLLSIAALGGFGTVLLILRAWSSEMASTAIDSGV